MAETKKAPEMEHYDPIFLTDNETKEEYVLDFCKESVKYMHSKKFAPSEDTINYIASDGDELWFYAFRMHHMNVARNKTDKLLAQMGGLTPAILERLFHLYNQALMSNHIIQTDEELAKNPHVTVKL